MLEEMSMVLNFFMFFPFDVEDGFERYSNSAVVIDNLAACEEE